MSAQKTNIRNVIQAALDPKQLHIMLTKVSRRFFDSKGGISSDQNLAWLKRNCSEFGAHAAEIDAGLWEESKVFESQLKEHAERVLAEIEHNLGGGGFYPMIYFLTRYLKPVTVVETGVAAGYSSSAILAALRENGRGMLWSSDFPYFRLPNPEKYIGVVVAEELKENWQLLVEGDENNLPNIVRQVETIDLLHYDSDKTYAGRERALQTLRPKLAEDAVIIIDDVQDNPHFHDLVQERYHEGWSVYKFEGKYIGLLGDLKKNSGTS